MMTPARPSKRFEIRLWISNNFENDFKYSYKKITRYGKTTYLKVIFLYE